MLNNKRKYKVFDKNKTKVSIIKPKKSKKFDPLKVMSINYLVNKKHFADPIWFVKPFLPEGLSILAGKSKIGKSFFSLNLAISVSLGLKFLKHFYCNKTTVYYLPLEDNLRRVQTRAQKMLPPKLFPKNLLIPTQIHRFPKLNQGGFECLKKIIAERPDIGVIIIDTLGRFIEKKNSYLPNFRQDYAELSKLQTFAIMKHISILLIHHTTKSSADDPFDEIQGTMGTQASPDNLMVIRRFKGGIQLCTRGRDFEEKNYTIKFDKDRLKWYIDGKPQEIGLSAKVKIILNYMKKDPTKCYQLKEIAKHTKDKRENTCNKLSRLVKGGFLEKNTEDEYYLNKDTYEELFIES